MKTLAGAIWPKIKEYNPDFLSGESEGEFEFIEKTYDKVGYSLDVPVEVIKFLLPLKPDEDTIFSVFLRDLYLNEIIADEKIIEIFGHDVLNILWGLKKLSSLNYAENDKTSQLEVLRKMFVATAKDLRVVVIGLAFRMQETKYLNSVKNEQKRLALTTGFI